MKDIICSIDYSYDLLVAVRLAAAGLCGAAIGYERENRQKPAGIKTHILVGVASALMMIISKYGFYDVLGEHVNLDPSRIAAGIVTAVGFLGTGVIFAHHQIISGVTTSAGIWATVGVGMAVGAGQYFAGIITTIFVLVVELFLGNGSRFSWGSLNINRIHAELSGGPEEMEAFRRKLESMGFKIKRFEFSQRERGKTKVTVIVSVPKGKSSAMLLEIKEPWLCELEVNGRLV